MIGFVLAAGFGTRLRPLTEHVPKALVPVSGQPLLTHALNRQAAASRNQSLLVNTHYLPGQIERFRETSPIPFAINFEPDIRGTGGALVAARHLLLEHDLACVTNVDILSPVDLDELAERFLATGAEAGLVAELSDTDGTIYYDPVDMAYRGVPADGAPTAGMRRAHYIGIAFYTPAFLRQLTEEDFSIVPAWKRARTTVLPLPEGTYWLDIGTPSALLQAHHDLLAGNLQLPLPDDLVIDPAIPCCQPRGANGRPGPFAWLETELPADCDAAHCVVLRGSRGEAGTPLRRTILSPWGVLDVDA